MNQRRRGSSHEWTLHLELDGQHHRRKFKRKHLDQGIIIRVLNELSPLHAAGRWWLEAELSDAG